jgi:hypothetical protein
MVASNGEPETACVFVHGWAGGPHDTWFGFPSRLRATSAKADFLFYGYESVRKSAPYSASKFRQFLRAVLQDPQAAIFEPSADASHIRLEARSPGFRHKKIVLCCHSLGAVVSRRALIDLESETPGLVKGTDIRMLLFAPAHCGSDLAKLAQDLFAIGAVQLPLAIAGTLAGLKLKSLRDLVRGSTTLETLKSENAALCAAIRNATGRPPTFLPRVFHAENDEVVLQNDFPGDPPFQPVDHHSHRSICKPTDQYDLPVRELVSLL